MLDLGFSAINSMELRELAAPHLQQLCDETGYTVNMAILDGVDIVYVERCRSSRVGQREIDLNLHVGSRLPAYCTSMGKVLLAFLEPDEREPLLDALDARRRGPNTLTSTEALAPSSSASARDGFAINNEELAYGLRSIAAPVRAERRSVAGDQPRRPPLDGVDAGARRASHARAAADGGRDLGAHRLQALVQRAEMYSVR